MEICSKTLSDTYIPPPEMSYSEFKIKVLAMIDDVLLHYLPVPTEFIEKSRLIPGIGWEEVKNSLGELTEHIELGYITRIITYNNYISELLSTRTLISDRTTFGWIVLTKTNLLKVVDRVIANVSTSSKYILLLLKMKTSGISLKRTTMTLYANDYVAEGKILDEQNTVIDNLITELKLYMH